MASRKSIELQIKIKARLIARGFRKESEYFELILAIQEIVEEIISGQEKVVVIPQQLPPEVLG